MRLVPYFQNVQISVWKPKHEGMPVSLASSRKLFHALPPPKILYAPLSMDYH